MHRVTLGAKHLRVAIIDGPVNQNLDIFSAAVKENRFLQISKISSQCADSASSSCSHGTMVASLLAGQTQHFSGLAPKCTFLIRPIYLENQSNNSNAVEVAHAIDECLDAGAEIINLSAALLFERGRNLEYLRASINRATKSGILFCTAAGNQSNIQGNLLAENPLVISVGACDSNGFMQQYSNLSLQLARNGLLAPGLRIPAIDGTGAKRAFTGTSAATPFVAAALALLKSALPDASPETLRAAILKFGTGQRNSLIPPTLQVWRTYLELVKNKTGRF